MQKRSSLVVTALLSGAVGLAACGTTPAEDRERLAFPARQDFPVGGKGVEALSPGTRKYTFEPGLDSSHLFVQIFSASMGHDHGVRATQWYGSLVFDPARLSSCAVLVTVSVEGLDPERDEIRDLMGQEHVSKADRDQIREHLRADNQLDLAKHDSIQFASKSCELVGERGPGGYTQVRVLGDLTMHGSKKETPFLLEVAVDEERVAARGVLTARHQEFGMEPYSMLGGLFKNKDELYFVMDVRGRRVPGK